MAFFSIYADRPPRKRSIPRVPSRRVKEEARPQRLKPIIQRGPFALIWVNPNPTPATRHHHDGPDTA